jgi:hypothetical protein
MSTDGNLAAQVLPAENGGYWTCTGWLEHSALQDVVRRETHLDLMAPVDDGCDEATFGDGEQGRRAITHGWTPTRRTGLSRPRRSHR